MQTSSTSQTSVSLALTTTKYDYNKKTRRSHADRREVIEGFAGCLSPYSRPWTSAITARKLQLLFLVRFRLPLGPCHALIAFRQTQDQTRYAYALVESEKDYPLYPTLVAHSQSCRDDHSENKGLFVFYSYFEKAHSLLRRGQAAHVFASGSSSSSANII
ncbi:hypothetical protein BDY19DRAFT_596375 [Irpex rosettiformis]|uniref:Uncharacterized protein n=1 Tax=Irpex rosettiformis TaxID=378272 RepID=A0ACB8UDJ0_9APHY|nr:hypothetical protein BDY19DRAFT_596375 [Irpex rosettiformis]